jgi:hypothetical protein
MDLKELQKLTVTKLREMAMEYEDITDASGMTKEQLQDVLCEKLGIEKEEVIEHKAGVDTTALKKKIKELKAQAQQAATSGDKVMAKRYRRQAHRANRTLKKSVIHKSP